MVNSKYMAELNLEEYKLLIALVVVKLENYHFLCYINIFLCYIKILQWEWMCIVIRKKEHEKIHW